MRQWAIIGFEKGLLPNQREAMVKSKATLLSIRLLRTILCEILLDKLTFPFHEKNGTEKCCMQKICHFGSMSWNTWPDLPHVILNQPCTHSYSGQHRREIELHQNSCSWGCSSRFNICPPPPPAVDGTPHEPPHPTVVEAALHEPSHPSVVQASPHVPSPPPAVEAPPCEPSHPPAVKAALHDISSDPPESSDAPPKKKKQARPLLGHYANRANTPPES